MQPESPYENGPDPTLPRESDPAFAEMLLTVHYQHIKPCKGEPCSCHFFEDLAVVRAAIRSRPVEEGPVAGHRPEWLDDVPTGWCECGKPYPHVPARPVEEGELPPRFIGFLVGEFMRAGFHKGVVAAGSDARGIFERWNASVHSHAPARPVEVDPERLRVALEEIADLYLNNNTRPGTFAVRAGEIALTALSSPEPRKDWGEPSRLKWVGMAEPKKDSAQ